MAGPKQRKKLKPRRQGATIAKVVAEVPNIAGGKFLDTKGKYGKSGKLLDTKSKKDERKKRSRMRHRQRGIK